MYYDVCGKSYTVDGDVEGVREPEESPKTSATPMTKIKSKSGNSS